MVTTHQWSVDAKDDTHLSGAKLNKNKYDN